MVHPLISLYSSTETEFTTNGLGSLSEATSCTVIEEANGEFELEMIYPVTGRRYKDLVNRAIIYAKPNPVDSPQPFRIYEISRPINGLVTFYAAHISYDLSGYPVKPFTSVGVTETMTRLKENAIISHPFTFTTDKDVSSEFTLDRPLSTRSVLGGIRGSILDLYGGEYKFDKFHVRLYLHRGSDRGVVIRYGKNLTDLQQEENCSRVYTGVLPYWQSYEDGSLVQLPEGWIPTEGSYNFTNIYTLDLSSEFIEEPTEEELRARAEKYIKDNELGTPKVSLTVSFAQLEQTEEYKHLSVLERVELFDMVTVEFPEMSVSAKAKVSKTRYNVLSGRYTSVTIGEVRANISDTIVEQGSDITNNANNARSELAQAVDRATKWITNGRGYMVAVKDEAGNWMEICSLDTPDINTAVNVWRWNNGGFGFSSHGYNGPYETAITQDGEIVANFITTGTLTASLIRAGVLKSIDEDESFYLDLENGILRMKAREFTIQGKTVDDISQEKVNLETERATKAESELSLKDDEISLRVSEVSNDVTNEADRAKKAESELKLASDQIVLRVLGVEDDLSSEIERAIGSEVDLAAAIVINAENINLKVSKGDVSSELSVEKDQVTIEGDRLVIKATNFQLTKEGTATMKNAKINNGTIVQETSDVKLTIDSAELYGGYKNEDNNWIDFSNRVNGRSALNIGGEFATVFTAPYIYATDKDDGKVYYGLNGWYYTSIENWVRDSITGSHTYIPTYINFLFIKGLCVYVYCGTPAEGANRF